MEIIDSNNFKDKYGNYEVDLQNQKKINKMVSKKNMFTIYWAMFFVLSAFIFFPIMVWLKFIYRGEFVFIFFLLLVYGFICIGYRPRLLCSNCKKRMSKISVRIVDFSDSNNGWYDTYYLCHKCKLKVDAKLTIE